jgi:hypothetical protein
MVYDITGLRFQPQVNPYWCWAAVTWMVLDFYAKGQGRSQCDIAALVTGGNCCPPPSLDDLGNPCLRGADLQISLAAVGHSGGRLIAQPQSFSFVRQEIAGRRPLCAQMARRTGDHYVVLSACADDQSLRVLDPEGWYETDFDTFTLAGLSSPRGCCSGWFTTCA